jgi:hypothetical protein
VVKSISVLAGCEPLPAIPSVLHDHKIRPLTIHGIHPGASNRPREMQKSCFYSRTGFSPADLPPFSPYPILWDSGTRTAPSDMSESLTNTEDDMQAISVLIRLMRVQSFDFIGKPAIHDCATLCYACLLVT